MVASWRIKRPRSERAAPIGRNLFWKIVKSKITKNQTGDTKP
jgi:hypothetical protein